MLRLAPSLKLARTRAMANSTRARRATHTYTEDPKATPMLRYQASLPPLPVPTISSTLAKYLETVQPLLTSAQFAHTQETTKAFASSPLAATLQKRLQERAERVGDNWLSEWWNDAAYMGYRDPVVVFVSYFFVHVEDRTRKTGPSRAAALVKAMLPFRYMVESGSLEPDKVRGTPLCMESYKWLFHASRYPTIPSDTAQKFSAAENNHIVVLRKNRFFVVPLTNPVTGQELSAAELEVQFTRIQSKAGTTPHPTPIGVLTSDNRDNWTHAREALLALPENAPLARKVESAMIIVCLDDTKPITRENLSWQTWVGDGKNRWYDKHQLIVYENGRSGFLGEHSCMDGTPTLRMNEFILATLALGKADLGPAATSTTGSDLPQPEELAFVVDDKVRGLVADAEKRFNDLVGAHDLEVLHYEGYGKNFIKTYKLSPDAWAQLVKQLAYTKMYGRLGVTYESAQTRKFKKGRTEVIRSASNEAKEWADAMVDANVTDPAHLRTLFQRAVARHMQYSAWAADGQGVDRHLFGLKKSLKEGEELPELYKDEAFAKSSHWELSTSQLSSKYFDGWGYGEVVPDGYGLSYSIGDDYIRWTITSLKRRTAELKHYLAEAATEVREMMEAARKADEKAKL
ncbi:Carnitine O-acetyltransferase, mitochondrial [Hypsizygus marmoreus]|uniref:Carnitine O-acetyltransferase, mitochondrial n=1 Tax=Hypsizygus marmoreus TaxID=39966 RepID=A0A369J8K5_HYPMA|nr:Carnitine O-acetyltransferase, mitochondrial [Hypsizygus marmoreus]